jgi:death-on-curing protein
MLLSAIAMPQSTFDGRYLNPDIPSMAAAYLFHITRNHASIDGNKRAGANAAITFLLVNGFDPTFSEEELVDLVLSVAKGATSKEQIGSFFAAHCRPADRE